MASQQHPSRSLLVVPIVAKQRDIRFSLQLDSLAARIEAAEATLRDLRMEYDELQAGQKSDIAAATAAAIDAESEPRENGAWLGHGLVQNAIQLLSPGPRS